MAPAYSGKPALALRLTAMPISSLLSVMVPRRRRSARTFIHLMSPLVITSLRSIRLFRTGTSVILTRRSVTRVLVARGSRAGATTMAVKRPVRGS